MQVFFDHVKTARRRWAVKKGYNNSNINLVFDLSDLNTWIYHFAHLAKKCEKSIKTKGRENSNFHSPVFKSETPLNPYFLVYYHFLKFHT